MSLSQKYAWFDVKMSRIIFAARRVKRKTAAHRRKRKSYIREYRENRGKQRKVNKLLDKTQICGKLI